MAGLSSIKKQASLKEIATGAGSALAAAAVLKGIGAATNYLNEKMDKKKFNDVVNYAKKKHPELRDVPKDVLMHQMNAFYTLAPRAAVNKELGASMLATTNDYGGSLDLATAKLISEIGSKSHKLSNSNDELIGFVTTGSKLSKN